jgi:hypothetical protein
VPLNISESCIINIVVAVAAITVMTALLILLLRLRMWSWHHVDDDDNWCIKLYQSNINATNNDLCHSSSLVKLKLIEACIQERKFHVDHDLFLLQEIRYRVVDVEVEPTEFVVS